MLTLDTMLSITQEGGVFITSPTKMININWEEEKARWYAKKLLGEGPYGVRVGGPGNLGIIFWG